LIEPNFTSGFNHENVARLNTPALLYAVTALQSAELGAVAPAVPDLNNCDNHECPTAVVVLPFLSRGCSLNSGSVKFISSSSSSCCGEEPISNCLILILILIPPQQQDVQKFELPKTNSSYCTSIFHAHYCGRNLWVEQQQQLLSTREIKLLSTGKKENSGTIHTTSSSSNSDNNNNSSESKEEEPSLRIVVAACS
jgi:hypothetical protein